MTHSLLGHPLLLRGWMKRAFSVLSVCKDKRCVMGIFLAVYRFLLLAFLLILHPIGIYILQVPVVLETV